MKKTAALLLWGISLFLLPVIFSSCSGGSPEIPLLPETSLRDANTSGHTLWGMWQFTADPEAGTLDATPLRGADFHLNVLPFLEPPVLVNLTIENLEFNGDLIDVDIALRHPFLGLAEFTGFDVSGILISSGNVTGFNDTHLNMPGVLNTRLLNPDGYSRWWNPVEFPVNDGTIFAYKDGLLGTPDNVAGFNATLNGYKYFCDDLVNPDAAMNEIDPHGRGVFSAGNVNRRHYSIQLGDEGLTFNYAVDASWMFPDGSPPYSAPEDFPPEANRPEAWRVSATQTYNTLWNNGSESGGELGLNISVYDWFNPDLNTVRVESPGNFTMFETSTPEEGDNDASTYMADISNATPSPGQVEILISVASEKTGFGGFIPGTPTTAYFTYTITVSDQEPVQCKNIPLRSDANALDIAIDHINGDLLVLYDDKWIYTHAKVDGCYDAGVPFFQVTDHLTQEVYFIDRAQNQFTSVAVTYVTPDTPGGWVYDPSGVFNSGLGMGPPHGLVDSIAFAAGTYVNDVGFVRGFYDYNGDPLVLVLRITMVDGVYQHGGVYTYFITDGVHEGLDRLSPDYVIAAETDPAGDYIWFLEDPDYYATRWLLHKEDGLDKMSYDNAYLGTGSQADDDNGWWDAKDITRDNAGHFFVLDQLSDGTPRAKMWSVDGTNVTSLGGFGNSSTISGAPVRIEGSDFDGDIVVLHGATAPQMISLFKSSEMPG